MKFNVLQLLLPYISSWLLDGWVLYIAEGLVFDNIDDVDVQMFRLLTKRKSPVIDISGVNEQWGFITSKEPHIGS